MQPLETRAEADAQKPETACIIGLGYVGLTLAIALARKGLTIYGVERSTEKLRLIRSGKAHFHENGVDVALHQLISTGKIRCFQNIQDIPDTDTFVITVGTPTNANTEVDISSLLGVADALCQVLKKDDLVLLRSTVRPGITREIAHRIEQASGNSFEFAFCPERTIEGHALEELEALPQIIGGLTPSASVRASKLFERLTQTIIVVDDPESAEMAKLINNSHRDLMFAFANEVAMACDAIGVSAQKVIDAACRDYSRTEIKSPGLVGGPCLEKDTYILRDGIRKLGGDVPISAAARRVNELVPHHGARIIAGCVQKIGINPTRIAILGLAFKGSPETDDTRGSMAKIIVKAMRAEWPHSRIVGYDPVTPMRAAQAIGLEPVGSCDEAINQADVVIIQTNHSEFANMDLEQLSYSMKNPSLVYDYWGLHSDIDVDLRKKCYYISLGNAWSTELTGDLQEVE